MTEMTDEAKEARTARLDAQADKAAEAATNPKAALSKGHVRVRVTKAGAGKISTGGSPRRQIRDTGAVVFDGEQLDPRFSWNDEVALPRPIAEELEKRGYAEIQE